MLRSVLVALLLLALIPATALANASAWASRSVLDRDAFTTAVGRALDTPEAQAALAERLSAALFDALVQVDGRVRFVLPPLLGLGPTASDRAIVDALEPRVLGVLDDPRIEAARERLLVAAHDAFLGLDDPASTVRLEGDALVVDAADLVRALADALAGQFGGLSIDVPDNLSADIELASAPGLAATSEALPTLDRLGVGLPLAAIAIGLLVLVLAHRRSRAAGSVGLAIALAGAACLAIVWLGGVAAADAESQISPALVDSTYDALSQDLVIQSAILMAAGFVLAVVGALAAMLAAGRSRRRRAERW